MVASGCVSRTAYGIVSVYKHLNKRQDAPPLQTRRQEVPDGSDQPSWVKHLQPCWSHTVWPLSHGKCPASFGSSHQNAAHAVTTREPHRLSSESLATNFGTFVNEQVPHSILIAVPRGRLRKRPASCDPEFYQAWKYMECTKMNLPAVARDCDARESILRRSSKVRE